MITWYISSLVSLFYVFKKFQQASGSGFASQPQPQPAARTSASGTASQAQAQAPARTTSVPQVSTPGANANRFKPPRKRAATAEVGSSSLVRGTRTKRGIRKPAS